MLLNWLDQSQLRILALFVPLILLFFSKGTVTKTGIPNLSRAECDWIGEDRLELLELGVGKLVIKHSLEELLRDILGCEPLGCLLKSVFASAPGKLRLFGLAAHTAIDQIFPIYWDTSRLVVVLSGS